MKAIKSKKFFIGFVLSYRMYSTILFLLLSSIGFSQDVTPPNPVEIEYVTVDPNTGNVTIKWQACTSVDVKGYNIYYFNGSFWQQIASELHPILTHQHKVTDSPACLANSQSESYKVAAYDGATPANVSLLSDPHSTIFLNLDFRPCYAETGLSWNPYTSWQNNVNQYEIYISVNSAAYYKFANIPGDLPYYNHQDQTPDVTYKYYVKAIDGSETKTSISNSKSVYTDMPHPPVTFNADFLTVLSQYQVQLAFSVDPNAEVNGYKLLRSDSAKTRFDTIKVFTPADVNIYDKITYIDNFNTAEDIYYYKLIAVNTCNVNIKTTNIASNILLNVASNDDITNSLIWNNYKNWLGGIKEYRIWRVHDNDTDLVSTVKYGDSIFYDNLEKYIYFWENPTPIKNNYLDQPYLNGKFCYYVVGYEDVGNPFNVYGISKSNTICTVQTPRLFVPNAFTPNNDGLNDIFMPYISFSTTDYLFSIYDRWGSLIFETSVQKVGWDGKFGGEKQPTGTYIYKITYADSDKKKYEQVGSFTLFY